MKLVRVRGSFIASTFEKTQTVTLAASGVTTPFSVAIADSDDTDDAADSVITVTLVDEGISTPLYILADAPGQMATATVTDDALPALGELSIASLVDQTFLGGDIIYRVTLDTPPTEDNTVSIAMEVSDTG